MKVTIPLKNLGTTSAIGSILIGTLYAQQPTSPALPTLDETVVTSGSTPDEQINPSLSPTSKLSAPISDTPRAVEIVTNAQFTERGAKNLEEALGYTSGVQGNTYGFDTRQDFIRIRGLSATNYKDGLQHNYHFYNNTPLELYSIEQIDVIKGPASLLYGRGAVGGTVNTVSKIAGPGHDNEIMTAMGSDARYEAGIDYSYTLSEDHGLFLRMVGYYRESDTYIDFVNDDSRFFMPSLTWQPTGDTSLSLLLNFQNNNSLPSLQFFPLEATQIPGRTLSNSTYGGEPSIDRYDTEQRSINLMFDHRFNDTFSLSANARYVSSSADYVEHTLVPPSTGAIIGALPPGYFHRILYGANHETDVLSGNVILTANHRTGPLDHTAQLGLDYFHADRDRSILPFNPLLFGLPYTYGGPVDLFNPNYGAFVTPLPDRTNRMKITEQDLGIFLRDQIKWDNFIVSLGARYDDYEMESSLLPTDQQQNWSFDAGIMYQFENGISPYYSYAESFEPQGIDEVTNTSYDPKIGTQHEIGAKWTPDENTLVTLSYFQVEEENRVIGTGLGSTQSGSVETEGVELSVNHRFHDFLFQASYTYLDTANNDLAGSPSLAGVPEHMASSWITYRPQTGKLRNFRAGLGVRYNGVSSDGIDQISTSSHTLVDAMVGYTWDNLDFQLNVTNLFDKQYIQTKEFSSAYNSTNAFLGIDRTVSLSATLNF